MKEEASYLIYFNIFTDRPYNMCNFNDSDYCR